MCAPSGDQLQVDFVNKLKMEVLSTHLSLLKKVLPGESSKGFVTSASSDQSVVFHIFTVRSSDWVARNSPTGSQQTPLTNP